MMKMITNEKMSGGSGIAGMNNFTDTDSDDRDSVKAVNCLPYTFAISFHRIFKENLLNPA